MLKRNYIQCRNPYTQLPILLLYSVARWAKWHMHALWEQSMILFEADGIRQEKMTNQKKKKRRKNPSFLIIFFLFLYFCFQVLFVLWICILLCLGCLCNHGVGHTACWETLGWWKEELIRQNMNRTPWDKVKVLLRPKNPPQQSVSDLLQNRQLESFLYNKKTFHKWLISHFRRIFLFQKEYSLF